MWVTVQAGVQAGVARMGLVGLERVGYRWKIIAADGYCVGIQVRSREGRQWSQGTRAATKVEGTWIGSLGYA